MADLQIPNPDEIHETKQKAFTKRVALTTGIFAVVLAVASLGGSNSMKDMLVSSQQANDQWSFFQAKANREHLYTLEAQRLEATLAERGPALSGEARLRLETLRKEHLAHAKRYRKDRDDISKDAKKHEQERELNRAKDPYFDYAGILLQIAIIMASIAMLAESRPTYWFSLVAAVLGLLFTLNGFLLFVRIPIFH